MKSKNDVINVYWAPAVYGFPEDLNEWEMMYPDPVSLYNDVFEKRNKEFKNLDGTFFACPAVKTNFKNTFVFKNVVKTEYDYNFNNKTGNLEMNAISPTSIGVEKTRGLVINQGPQLCLTLSYIFFADQSLEAYFSAPYFHKPGYTNYGTIIPGNFNIGKWFRPYNVDIQLWEKNGKFIILEDEPIFYINFKTDSKIKLHRFKHTKQLSKYSEHCVNSPITIKSKASLAYRYKIFTESRFNETILSEIKKNLVGESYE